MQFSPPSSVSEIGGFNWSRQERYMWWGKLAVAILLIFATWRMLPKDLAPLKFIWTHPWHVAVAALLRPVFTLVMAARTYSLAREVLQDLPLGSIIRATYIGQMANLVLPGGAGGDLIRGTILWRKSNRPWPQIVTVLVIDRFLGTLSLLSCVAFFSLPLLILFIQPKWLIGSIVLGAAVLTGIWLGRDFVLYRIQHSSLWRDTASALKQMPRSRWVRAAILALTGHLILITSISFVFTSVGIAIGWADRAGIIALSLFLSSLPLTLGGHGIREGTLVLLLAAPVAWTRWPPFATMDVALALAAATWIIHVVTNFMGGLIALGLGSHKTSRKPIP